MAGRKKSVSLSKKFSPMDRIETQIHRRRKIKAFSPLQTEWDCLPSSRTKPSPINSGIEGEPTSD